MALFMDAKRANCAGCHQMNPGSGNPQDSLFSKFTYFATGIPRNKAIPANADAKFYDLGLCGPLRIQSTLPATLTATSTVSIEEFCGKVRMPTLRNVAHRPAYMHNGFFKDLREVVRFYSTRNSNPERWIRRVCYTTRTRRSPSSPLRRCGPCGSGIAPVYGMGYRFDLELL